MAYWIVGPVSEGSISRKKREARESGGIEVGDILIYVGLERGETRNWPLRCSIKTPAVTRALRDA